PHRRSSPFPYTTLFRSIQLEQLSQVMAESGSERGVLPARAVAGTAETIHAAVWPLLHLHVAFELFQSLERSRATRSFPEGHSKTDRKSTRLDSSHVAIS